MKPQILVLSGSERSGSYNARLASLAAKALGQAGAETTEMSLKALALPIYDGDIEAAGGVPEAGKQLRAAIDSHPATFIATPEYNSGYPALLKNALDWASRVKGTPLFGGKVVGIAAASPSARGGYRSLTQLRSMLELGMGALVLPEMVAVANAAHAFNEDGSFADANLAKLLDTLAQRLVAEAGRRAA